MNKEGLQILSVSQIFILVMGIISFSFIVGEIDKVSAQLAGSPEAGGPTNADAQLASAPMPTSAGENAKVLIEAGGSSEVTKPIPEFFSSEYFLKGTGGFDLTRILVQSAAWAGIAYGAIKMLGSLFGFDDTLTNALAASAAAGFGIGRVAFLGAKETSFFGTQGQGWIGSAKSFGIGTGLLTAALVFYLTYSKTKEKTYEYTCEPWQAPTGGSKCEECNKQGILPCSEYQCRSLGQACKLVNPGTNEEMCVWVNQKDVNPPIIQPWLNALLADYEYTPDNAISPPDRGVFIENNNATNKCVTAFTPMTFGINLDEPAKCKIDYLRKQNFSDMDYWFGGSQLSRYNHTQIMSLPGKAAYETENIEINNDGKYEVYVRCQDENGNFNTADFVFKFCVNDGPDTTAPAIITTSIINGMPVAYNQSSINLTVYTNEPAECKWGSLDEEYADIKNTMTCSKSVVEMNAQMLYKCATVLTGLKSAQENKFYFRCKDNAGNINAESYPFILGGTIPLVISSVGPNGTVRDNTDPVKVTLKAETTAGAEEGKAICYYKNASSSDTEYVKFFQSASHTHSQDLFLPEGSYNYDIKCVDLGGNSVKKSTSFYVESDSEAPLVVRVFKEESNIKLITDEEAECVYDVLNCNYLFGDGIAFTTLNGLNHFTEWDTSKNFYVKCKDEYGNEPAPDQCSIVVQPFEIPSKI